MHLNINTKEHVRLKENYAGHKKWLKWGPYLSERQWGTVREDYSEGGDAWNFFTHDQARSKVYRWGEDGIAGISDEFQKLCFSVSFWNTKDDILKERLFGLTGPEGNHGEDCKELYYYLDNTPSHSYMKYLYKYTQNKYPYKDLVTVNALRNRDDREFEILDSDVFRDNAYFDIFVEYAKANEEDILIEITIFNRGKNIAPLYILPQLWFRNKWMFIEEEIKPNISKSESSNEFDSVELSHAELGTYHFYYQKSEHELFTENENNTEKLWGVPNNSPFVKDLFHTAILENKISQFKDRKHGTKFAPIYNLEIAAGGKHVIKLRLCKEKLSKNVLNKSFDTIFNTRKKEADEFYNSIIPASLTEEVKQIQRQSYSGMLWSKQYYNIDIIDWLEGDKKQPTPPRARKTGRNAQWETLNNEDIISMPDKWEYPWYAAWDLAFHCIPFCYLDIEFAKNQLLLFLREWYMHPNGQIPAYEWSFSDVNPPVHGMSCLKIYKLEFDLYGKKDIEFLKKAFHKLCLNFTWWVNRKDTHGKNVFQGGFLGLDNIGIFDRSSNIPQGGHLEQTDGTSWMAMYCLNMLEIALEISKKDASYEPMTTKFFEHFALISQSLNKIGKNWVGAWNEDEGFFYDILVLPNNTYKPLKVRSLVGLTTLFATLLIKKELYQNSPEFIERMNWFNQYLLKQKSYTIVENIKSDKILFHLVPKNRLKKLLHTLFDEQEFLSEFGIRSTSKIHQNGIFENIDGELYGLYYEPAESTTGIFGGNSNWRGPIWMNVNYMIIQSLRSFYEFYGEELKVEFPSNSGNLMDLNQVANELSKRLISIFKPNHNQERAVNGLHAETYKSEHFKDLILFYEYFHGDNGRGIGASHQTGWTGIITQIINEIE